MPGRTRIVAVAVNRFCTPVALKRTTAGSTDIERKIAIVLFPDETITFDIHQVPGRQRETVQVFHHRASRRLKRQPVLHPRQPPDIRSVDHSPPDGTHSSTSVPLCLDTSHLPRPTLPL